MTRKIYFIGDTHFGHKNILTFTDNVGKHTREFNSIEEHDMTIIERWNSVVRPIDIVYHLGDVAFNKSKMDYFKLLNGKKRLVMGNHDMYKTHVYAEHFQQLVGVKHMTVDGFKFVVSHVPLHPDCLGRFGLNIHGHLHQNYILDERAAFLGGKDERYFNVSCEQVDYTPISLEEILERKEGMGR